MIIGFLFGEGYFAGDMSVFFFSSRRRHTRFSRDWSSDVCSSDLPALPFIKSGDVEDLWQGKAGRAARPPEGLQRPGRLAFEPALQGCYARRRNVAPEAVEAMH